MLAGVYLGHSYRNNGRITVSLLFVEALDQEKQLIRCRARDAGKYEYQGFLTLLKSDLLYCLLENEMLQIYVTTPALTITTTCTGCCPGSRGSVPG